MKLFNHEDKPVVEGRLLTLACLAKGSGKIKFHWYKDGANVSVHKTTRNMWETRINSTESETQMSILNIDKADVLDEGKKILTEIRKSESTNCKKKKKKVRIAKKKTKKKKIVL